MLHVSFPNASNSKVVGLLFLKRVPLTRRGESRSLEFLLATCSFAVLNRVGRSNAGSFASRRRRLRNSGRWSRTRKTWILLLEEFPKNMLVVHRQTQHDSNFQFLFNEGWRTLKVEFAFIAIYFVESTIFFGNIGNVPATINCSCHLSQRRLVHLQEGFGKDPSLFVNHKLLYYKAVTGFEVVVLFRNKPKKNR